MAIYHSKNSSLIDRIEVRSPRHGIAQATITLKENASALQLETLRTQLGAQKFSTLMDTADGRAVIQVRGLKDEKALLLTLDKLGLMGGGIEKEITPNDLKKKAGFGARVRGKALFLSALFYDLGNAAFFVSGIVRGRHNKDGKMTANDKSEFMIGGAFGIGDVLMTAYGKDKGDEELAAATQGLKQHLHRKGIELPQGNALNPDTLHESGAFKATDRWLRKHIVHIKCLTEFAGGLFTIHSAVKPGNRNNGKLVAGFLISVGWMATGLLEKPRGHQILNKSGAAFIPEPITKNPRGWIARPLAMGNNIANLVGAYNERKKFHDEVLAAQSQVDVGGGADAQAQLTYTQRKQHDYIYNIISACAFLVANVLFGLSNSKKRPKETEDDKSMMQDLVLMSANVLAKQPERVREAAIDDTAEYVSTLAHINMNKTQVAEAIRDKITSLTQSAWVSRVQPASPAPQLTR